MIKNSLGNTGLSVSQIGLGTVKFGRNQKINYPTHFELPTDQEIINLLALAKDSGINLLDTAPAYSTSEERLGKLLTQRDTWIICTKVGEEFNEGMSHYDFSSPSILSSIERSLMRLGTDYLDLVLVHSNGQDKKIIEETECFATLQKLKTKGLIRAFGMSTKTIEGGKLTVDLADTVMVTYNPIHTEEKSVIDYARQHGKGVLIKKALASGHLSKIPGENTVKACMDFILKEKGISSTIVGTLSPEHLKQIVSFVAGNHEG
jgi:aryl-alcohol dehydrogenase-like predicted oxidoreductase